MNLYELFLSKTAQKWQVLVAKEVGSVTKLAAKSNISLSQALDNVQDDRGFFGKVTGTKHLPRIRSVWRRMAKSARPIAEHTRYSRKYNRYLLDAWSTERDAVGRIAPVIMAVHGRHKITPDLIQRIAAQHGRAIEPTHVSGMVQAVAKHRARRALNRKLLIGGAATLAAAGGYGIYRALKRRKELKQRARNESIQTIPK